jgi:hypothetical protein
MSDVPAPPPPARAFRVPWTEPTRRLPFSPRFSYDARYGASLVAVLLGGYLLLFANVSQVTLGLSGRGFPLEQTVYLLIQYLFAVLVVVVGLLIAPGTQGRRVFAVVAVLIVLVVWTLLVSARMTGAASPLPAFVTGFVVSPVFIVPLVTTLGWLIVRERPAVSYLLLVATLFGGTISFAATLNAVPAIVTMLIAPPIAGAIGIGIAWGARGIAATIQRMHLSDGLIDQPPAV